jgi:aerobic-type carbon monoxide dehydrogenase small subunit (CoxS/CutS family)
MRKSINIQINGRWYALEIAPHVTLLEVLREQLGLTGAKEACDGGECGACTVIGDGKTILSCLTLAVEMDGKSITTIEGLAQDGDLAEIQKAFVAEGAIQCGFCTPGMVLSAQALLSRHPHPSREEVTRSLSGNLCRCTGYIKAIAAVMSIAEKESAAD